MILKMDPDFNNLIPPLMPDELKQLEQNILSLNQCLEGIVVWNNVIVDGHSRYAICREHGIAFEVSRIHFASKEDAALWIVENQLGRRNLTDATRIELACLKVEMLRQKAKENQSAAGGDMRDGKKPTHEKPINVRKEIAAEAGVGEEKVYRYMKIVGEGAPELAEQVKRGEMKIGTAYNKMRAETKTVKVFFDDTDIRYRNSSFGRQNVLTFIGVIGKLYGFVEEAALIAHEMQELGGVIRLLEGQLRWFENIPL